MLDCTIIGGGPAGMSAATYLLRAGKTCLILEKESFGGQMATSPLIENYPSVEKTSGLELSNKMFNQVKALGGTFDIGEVKSIKKINEKHFLITTDFDTYESKSIILCNGVTHRRLNLKNEIDLIGNGLSYCATCDGAFFKDREVAVIGDANSALQYALMLSNICKKVTICALFDKLFAEQTLIDSIYKKDNIDILFSLDLKEYLIENSKLVGLKFLNKSNNQNHILNVDGVFIAIGKIPNNKFLENILNLDKNGYIVTDENMETSVNGIYAAGDCRVKKIRQVVTAVSDGAIAAIEIAKYLNA